MVSTGVELGVGEELHDEEKLCVGVNVGGEQVGVWEKVGVCRSDTVDQDSCVTVPVVMLWDGDGELEPVGEKVQLCTTDAESLADRLNVLVLVADLVRAQLRVAVADDE